MTPITGRPPTRARTASRPTAAAVLQATTRHFTPCAGQCRCGLHRVARHGVRALRAVGQPRGIAQVHEALVRQRAQQRGQHREAADPRIEDADGRAVQCAYASGRSCGNAITSRIEGESVKNMTSRSMPTPSPAVGGMPYSSART